MLFAGPPFCAGYALHACRGAAAKYPARAGLALAAVELLILAALVIIGLFAADGS